VDALSPTFAEALQRAMEAILPEAALSAWRDDNASTLDTVGRMPLPGELAEYEERIRSQLAA
jgi:uncharacterized membrane protein YgcG